MSKLINVRITNKGLYWGLIATFLVLYVFVAFVSTLHAIDFFKLANVTSLAILLGVAYEVGQASVLFSILMTKNKDKFLPWALMILLTALQVTANVYASFKHMVSSGSNDWQYWQKSILVGVQAPNPEMYQVIISWISGALLPIIALGLTALVAENIKMMIDEESTKEETKLDSSPPKERATPEIEKPTTPPDNKWVNDLAEESRETLRQQFLDAATKGSRETDIEKNAPKAGNFTVIAPSIQGHLSVPNIEIENGYPNELENNLNEPLKTKSEEMSGYGMAEDDMDREVERMIPLVVPEELQAAAGEIKRKTDEIIEKNDVKLEISSPKAMKKTPKTLKRGWHLKKRYVDSNGDVYINGVFSPLEKGQPEKPKELKKA